MNMSKLKQDLRRLGRKSFGHLTCKLASASPSLLTIALMREVNCVLMSAAEMHAITETIRSIPLCRLLVFGLGHDSRYWVASNSGGTTVFLENDSTWAHKIAAEIGGSRIVDVRYSHRRSEWRSLLNTPELLHLGLPTDVRGVFWDVILVDGPTGMLPEQHGRMQSIFAASQLVSPKGHVFVHDCDREVERIYCDRFFGPNNFLRQVGVLRHYQSPFQSEKLPQGVIEKGE